MDVNQSFITQEQGEGPPWFAPSAHMCTHQSELMGWLQDGPVGRALGDSQKPGLVGFGL